MINIYYRYSTLDKEHCYGIEGGANDIQVNWIWYYLGQSKLSIYKNSKLSFAPFKGYDQKLIKSYKQNHGAKKLAKLISNFIIKHYYEKAFKTNERIRRKT